MTGENVVRAFFSLIWHNKRRYGGYTVHIGVVLLLIGVTAFYAFKESGQQTLTKGESMTVGAYTLTYDSFNSYSTEREAGGPAAHDRQAERQAAGRGQADARVLRQPRSSPGPGSTGSPTSSETCTSRCCDYQDDGAEVLAKVDINPGVSWLWIGGFVMLLGGIIAIWPDKREQRRLGGSLRTAGEAP